MQCTKVSTTYSRRAVQKKSLSKHINMGSTFVGLNATNPFPKTDHDLETLFKRYYIYCHRIEKAKGKS